MYYRSQPPIYHCSVLTRPSPGLMLASTLRGATMPLTSSSERGTTCLSSDTPTVLKYCVSSDVYCKRGQGVYGRNSRSRGCVCAAVRRPPYCTVCNGVRGALAGVGALSTLLSLFGITGS